MRYSYGVLDAMVWCEDCDWKIESYKNAQATQNLMPRDINRVHGELGIAFSYNSKEEDSV